MAWVEQAHADAVLGLLADAPPASPALVVLDGQVPDGTEPPYVLVYPSTTTPTGTSLTSDQDRAVTRFYCHCVGADAKAARAVAGRVAAALLNVTPTITGRVCWPIRDDDAGAPPDKDETTGVLVMDQLAVYRLESVPT